MSITFPPALYLPNGSGIQTFDEESWDEVKRDSRGILMLWSPKQRGHRYIMGMDPTVGITDWSRTTRQPNDTKTDNGAIVVYDIGAETRPIWKIENGNKVPDVDQRTGRQRLQYRDVQVAEFRAPCDAVEIARIANIIGHIYTNEEGEPCELIWEAAPGPGLMTTQELLRLGYSNLWHWEYLDSTAEQTSRLGWRSYTESVKLLWFRSRRHLMQENVVVRSKWLRLEYANAEVDWNKMRAMASYGNHDDLLMASNLALWAGNKWTYEAEVERQEMTETPAPLDFQRFAPGLGDENASYDDWKQAATAEWGEGF